MDYYYTRGLNFYENDNYVEALKNYREAYKYVEGASDTEFRAILEVEMACCYRNLNLLRETQLMYYKALSDSKYEASFDGVIGLIDVFGTGNNADALRYYMDYAAKKGYSRELDYIDAATQFFSQRDYRVEPSPDQNMLELGKKLVETGQYEFARQLLDVIPPEAPAYRESCAVLSTLYNGCGEYEKALAYAEKASAYGVSVETQVNTVLALYKLGRTEAFEEALEALTSGDVNDVASLSRIVRTAALLGDCELVKKFGKKLAAVSPLRGPMLSYAVALSNTGELREARKIMVMLQALYPYDAVVQVYSQSIAACTEPSDFSLTGELPQASETRILESLNAVLAESDGDRNQLRIKMRDRELRTGILMIFQAGSDNSKRILCDLAADVPYFERYIRDCLMDPGYPDADKRILLPIAVRKFRKRPIYLTCRDICRPLYGKPPMRASAKWREAYCLAYSTLALFGCENYEKDFDTVFSGLQLALGKESNIDDLALAALIANRTGKVSALRDNECCIELFGADRETFLRYKNKLGKHKPVSHIERHDEEDNNSEKGGR